MKIVLTISQMLKEAEDFAEIESIYAEPSLFGITDGKAIGTYIEISSRLFLQQIMKSLSVARLRELICRN